MTDLLADERRRVILKQLNSAGTVRVAELATMLSVAEETVRRDLKLMDEQGLLIRTHGGAVQPEEAQDSTVRAIEIPFEQRRRAMMPQKQAIAQAAFLRIGDVGTLALDGSTTAWELATLLHSSSQTVITNSLMVTTLLASRPNGPQVINIGGTLDRKLMMFGGMIALEALRHVHIDVFAFSCAGIDPMRGFSEPTENAAQVKRQLLRMADRAIVMVDSTKFLARSSVLFGTPSDVDELITDAGAPQQSIDQLQSQGLPVTKLAD